MLSKPLYEVVPYSCIGVGIVGILFIDNAVAVLAGSILYVLGALIWTMRFHCRHPAKQNFIRRGKVLSEDVYEYKPFILFAIALSLLAFKSNIWLFTCSFLIGLHCAYIFYMRVRCRT